MSTVRDILNRIHLWSPPETAQDYDNVGLLVGDPAAHVRTALVALDLTHEVADEAARLAADVIVTHHPLLFKPIKSIRPDDAASSIAYRLVRSNCAHIAAHTNLDAAPDGVSHALAATLGLKEIEPLDPLPGNHFKLVTFVPATHAEVVRDALSAAGAGQIGLYSACAFETPGTGYFRAEPGSAPFVGTSGDHVESVEEMRIEVELKESRLRPVVRALKLAHPYEEVPYDAYRLQNLARNVGLGAVGNLKEPCSLSGFLQHTAEKLETPALRFAGSPDAPVTRVAVCGGSGRSLIPIAQAAGADAFVTADISYHSFFDTVNAEGTCRMAIVDAGHYETEVCAEELLLDRLRTWFPDISWIRTGIRTSAMRVFVTNH